MYIPPLILQRNLQHYKGRFFAIMHEYHKQRLNLEDRPNTQPIIDHQTRDFIFIMKAGVFNIIQEYFAYNATYVLNI